MLFKFSSLVGVGITSVALANTAWAEDVNVTTAANSAKLGGEFRSELLYDDHGLEKTDDYKPKSSTAFELQKVNIKLSGKLNPKTEYAFRFNLLGADQKKSVVDYAYGTHWLSDMIGFSIGKMKTLEGGWDVYTSSFKTHAIGFYGDNLPVDLYQPMMAVHFKAAGQVTLQVFNDVFDDGDDKTYKDRGQWNKSKQPTFALGWMGQFGPIEPLFNLGTYDNQKSRWIDVGVRANMAGLLASVDFNQNSQSDKDTASGKAKSKENVTTNISVRAAYEIKGAATPWLYFSTMTVKQHDEDIKYNLEADPETGLPTFNDNGQAIGVGADLASFGENWNPYIALVSQSGKFMEGTEEKTKSKMMVRLGVLGEI